MSATNYVTARAALIYNRPLTDILDRPPDDNAAADLRSAVTKPCGRCGGIRFQGISISYRTTHATLNRICLSCETREVLNVSGTDFPVDECPFCGGFMLSASVEYLGLKHYRINRICSACRAASREFGVQNAAFGG